MVPSLYSLIQVYPNRPVCSITAFYFAELISNRPQLWMGPNALICTTEVGLLKLYKGENSVVSCIVGAHVLLQVSHKAPKFKLFQIISCWLVKTLNFYLAKVVLGIVAANEPSSIRRKDEKQQSFSFLLWGECACRGQIKTQVSDVSGMFCDHIANIQSSILKSSYELTGATYASPLQKILYYCSKCIRTA